MMPTTLAGRIKRRARTASARMLVVLLAGAVAACTMPVVLTPAVTPPATEAALTASPPAATAVATTPTVEATVTAADAMTPDAAEDNAVYAVVIQAFYITEAITQVVVLAHTEPGAATAADDDALAPYLQESFGASLDADTLADFLLQRRAAPTPLARDFALPVEDVLLDAATFDTLVNRRGDWQQFLTEYPGAEGVISLSPVGYNPARTQALVYTGFVGDLGTGQGYYVLLNKQAGQWVVAQSALAWIS